MMHMVFKSQNSFEKLIMYIIWRLNAVERLNIISYMLHHTYNNNSSQAITARTWRQLVHN